MKRFLRLLSTSVLLLSFDSGIAQTASTYYLPLRVGNYLRFQSSDRTTTHAIIQSDSISGHQYFLEMRSEVMTGNGITNTFAIFWLRKDAGGEVLIGAMGAARSIDGYWSTNVDSAMVFNPPGSYFSTQTVTPGYSTQYSMEGYTWNDTTMSMTETVQTPAGSFANCVKIRQTKRQTSTGNIIYVEFTYHAPGIGIVKIARDGWSSIDLVAYNVATSVDDNSPLDVPACFSVNQNYPNPFNPSTTISFTLSSESSVSLKVIDILGREVATLVSEEMPAGTYSRQWSAYNMPSGVYLYRLRAGDFVKTEKMILMK
jgi:hypothetical protein